MKLTIDRNRWLRGSASHLMTRDGCGCVIGHYLLACGVPKEVIAYRYGFGEALVPFGSAISTLGEFEDDDGKPFFRTTPECDQIIGVNDGDPRSIHDFHVSPVNNDAQREAVLIRLMRGIGCKLKFVGVVSVTGEER